MILSIWDFNILDFILGYLLSFKPSIEGFKHCRLILSIDDTHLYEKYKGTLMIVMGCDENNKLLPLTFAITKGENIDSRG